MEYDAILNFGDYGYVEEYADPWHDSEDKLGYESFDALHDSFTNYMTQYYGVEVSPELEAYAANH